MNILLFGISNVGKSAIGECLSQKLDFDFYDLDELVKSDLKITLEEFVNTGTLAERDRIRCDLLNAVHYISGNKVIAVSPLSYIDGIRALLDADDVFALYLYDSADNIFDRLVFSDENDRIYKDDEYKMLHLDHYMHEIEADLAWYGAVYEGIKNRFDISGRPVEEAAECIMKRYHLNKKEK